MTDFASMKPVNLMPSKQRLVGAQGEIGPVLDTNGWGKLGLYLNNGASSGQYGRFYLEFSSDGVAFNRDHASLLLLAGGAAAPAIGEIGGVEHAWVDLVAEKRYVRIVFEHTDVGAAGTIESALTGILFDPMTTELADKKPFVTIGADTRE
ncbi:MAG: hypothetical protein JKY61_12345 [Planctomycetes bacterium]|nr:hypothetical protein [Planctomycetota bacterium]